MSGSGLSSDAETEMRRHARRNYIAHSVDGGLFVGAMAFTSTTTVLPTMVKNLGGPDWLITLAPVLMSIGFFTPPIFTAHLIERLPRYMPLLLATGISQRIFYLAAGLVLVLGAGAGPTVALAAVAMAPLVTGIAGGSGMTAWQQLVVRTVPENRRSSLFAMRYAISCVIGVAAGFVVKAVLDSWPGTVGYGILHLAAFATLAVSYIVFAMIREPTVPVPADRAVRGLRENLRAIPGLIRSQGHIGLYLAAIALVNGIFILIPFLAIRAQQMLARPESYTGDLLVAQMTGAILGNLVSGYLGNRHGGRLVMILGQAVFIALSAWAIAAATDWEFRAIFFLFGFAFFALQVGANTLSLEICPLQDRSTYLAIILFFNLPTMAAATAASAVLWNEGRGFWMLAVLTIVCAGSSLALAARLREPRAARQAAARPPDL
jgi:MFS family permease